MVLTCKPSAMHWAPGPDISFCQRESPSNLKFNFSASPSSCALVSVRAFLPSSSVTKVRFLHSATEHTHAGLAQTDPPSYVFHLRSPLFRSPLAIGSSPSSLRSQVLSTKCSSTRLLSRTLATLCAPDTPICVQRWIHAFTFITEHIAQSLPVKQFVQQAQHFGL